MTTSMKLSDFTASAVPFALHIGRLSHEHATSLKGRKGAVALGEWSRSAGSAFAGFIGFLLLFALAGGFFWLLAKVPGLQVGS